MKNRLPFLIAVMIAALLIGVVGAAAQESLPFLFETDSIIDLELQPKEGSASDFIFLVKTRDDCPDTDETENAGASEPVARVIKNDLKRFEFNFPDLNLSVDPLVMKSVQIVPERVIWRSVGSGGEYDPWEASFDPVIEYYFLTDPRRRIEDDASVYGATGQIIIPTRKTLELYPLGPFVSLPFDDETQRWAGDGWVDVESDHERLFAEMIHRGEAVGSESYEVGIFNHRYYDGQWVGGGGSSPHVESLKAKSYRPVTIYQFENVPELDSSGWMERRFEQTWVRPTFRVTWLTSGNQEVVREVSFEDDWIFHFGTFADYFELESCCVSVTVK